MYIYNIMYEYIRLHNYMHNFTCIYFLHFQVVLAFALVNFIRSYLLLYSFA